MANKPVTDAELAVLKELWAIGPATIRQLTDRLYPDGGTAHYATVQKLLERLALKGCVGRTQAGRVNVFSASVERHDLIDSRLRDTADKLCEGALAPLLTHLVSASELTGDELADLRDLVGRLVAEKVEEERAVASLHVLLLINGVTASVLAVVVAAVGRWLAPRPQVMHVLWLVVLLKLVTPPVVEVGVFPALAGAPSGPASAATATASLAPRPTALAAPAPRVAPSPLAKARRVERATLLGAAWLLAAASVLATAAWRAWRFHHALAAKSVRCGELDSVVRGLAATLGLARVPAVRVLEARLSPMLWCPLRAPELLFPAPLLGRLRRGERDTLIVHELAHARRGDHLVRFLELLVTALHWWNPLVWWARRELRRHEERCCDDVVRQTLPGRESAYAEGLLKTAEFIAGAPGRAPALGCGATAAHDIKERLTRIMRERASKRLSSRVRAVLALIALALLGFAPGRISDAQAVESAAGVEDRAAPPPAVERRYTEEMVALERRTFELERALKDLHGQRRDLELEIDRARLEEEVARADKDAARLAAAGRSAAAERLKREALELRRQHELDQRAHELERRWATEAEVAAERARELQLEAAQGDERTTEMRELEDRLAAELRALERVHEQKVGELEQEMYDAFVDRARADVGELERAGEVDSARKLRLEILLREAELELRNARANEEERDALSRHLGELRDKARALGRDELAARLEAELREIREGF